jgi:hypothetical protein
MDNGPGGKDGRKNVRRMEGLRSNNPPRLPTMAPTVSTRNTRCFPRDPQCIKLTTVGQSPSNDPDIDVGWDVVKVAARVLPSNPRSPLECAINGGRQCRPKASHAKKN